VAEYPQPAGFVKALFVGQIRQDLLLPYHTLTASEARVVEQVLTGLQALAKEIDAREIDREQRIPDTVIQGMARLGLFGLTIPPEHGGLGLGVGGYGRVVEAVTAVCPALMLLLGAHLSIGLKGVLLYGNEEQKARYLPRLATGKAIAAFALTEPQAGSDAQAIRSTAIRDGEGWRLNGSKIWITNGDIASMITVFAATPEVKGGDPLTAFLVEPGLEGFTLGPTAIKMGLHGSNAAVLRFDNVFIPEANVLGRPGEGFKIAVHVLNSGRLGLAASCIGAMKHSLGLVTEWVLQRKAFGNTISEYELIQRKIAQMAMDIFVTESMVQVTTGLAAKGVENEVEAAIAKVFATEAMWRAADESVQMAGGRGYVGPFPYERLLRDSRVDRIFEGTNEILRLFIFEQGTKPLRQYMRNAAKSARGMLALAGHRLSHLGEPAWMGQAPPSERLSQLVDMLRDAAGHLHRDTEATLQRHGKALIQRQMLMARLADMASDTFGMAAVLSRLESLSVDEGALSQALELAEPYFCQAMERFERNREALARNDDAAWVQVARMTYERGGYPLA
jgi:acyl-CoA dehydrogenase family protein 9